MEGPEVMEVKMKDLVSFSFFIKYKSLFSPFHSALYFFIFSFPFFLFQVFLLLIWLCFYSLASEVSMFPV